MKHNQHHFRNLLRRVSVLCLAFVLCLALCIPALAGQDTFAADMRLYRTEGTVAVQNADARELSIRENMKLYSGYIVATGEDGKGYVVLDGDRAVMLNPNSRMEIRKEGNALELVLLEGDLLFNIPTPLSGDESLDIRTSTMVTGIRGTSGFVLHSESFAAAVLNWLQTSEASASGESFAQLYDGMSVDDIRSLFADASARSAAAQDQGRIGPEQLEQAGIPSEYASFVALFEGQVEVSYPESADESWSLDSMDVSALEASISWAGNMGQADPAAFANKELSGQDLYEALKDYAGADAQGFKNYESFVQNYMSGNGDDLLNLVGGAIKPLVSSGILHMGDSGNPEPTPKPTKRPTRKPTRKPTPEPTPEASVEPTPEVTPELTPETSAGPTPEMTADPSAEPTPEATADPSAEPTPEATADPSAEPTPEATADPSAEPTPEFTPGPTPKPTPLSMQDVIVPTSRPTVAPSNVPSSAPSAWPSDDPGLETDIPEYPYESPTT